NVPRQIPSFFPRFIKLHLPVNFTALFIQTQPEDSDMILPVCLKKAFSEIIFLSRPLRRVSTSGTIRPMKSFHRFIPIANFRIQLVRNWPSYIQEPVPEFMFPMNGIKANQKLCLPLYTEVIPHKFT